MVYLVRLLLFSICFIVLMVFFEYVINKFFKGNEMELNEKDKTLVEGLIENDMLNFYIVSLISGDNEDTIDQWKDNKVRLLKLKQCIKEMHIADKKEIIRRINDSINIVDKEIKKYD